MLGAIIYILRHTDYIKIFYYHNPDLLKGRCQPTLNYHLVEMEFYMENKNSVRVKMPEDEVKVIKILGRNNLPDRLFALYLICPENDGDQWNQRKTKAITSKDWDLNKLTPEEKEQRASYRVQFKCGETEADATNDKVKGFIVDTDHEDMMYFVISRK
ncbi:uncharacterized protein LOC120326241 [Styela clava]